MQGFKRDQLMPSSEHRPGPLQAQVWEVHWTLCPDALYPVEPQVTEAGRGACESGNLGSASAWPWASLSLGVPYLFHVGLSSKASESSPASAFKPLSFKSPIWSPGSQPEHHCPLVAAARWQPPNPDSS